MTWGAQRVRLRAAKQRAGTLVDVLEEPRQKVEMTNLS